MSISITTSMCRSRPIPGLKRGQAALEVALVVPVLTVLLLIVGEFLRVYYMTIELNNAARAGVQYGVNNPANAANLTGMQQAALNDGSDISGMTATATEYCECSDGSSVSCGTADACSDERIYDLRRGGYFSDLLYARQLAGNSQIDCLVEQSNHARTVACLLPATEDRMHEIASEGTDVC
jgi:hypothetical protein